MGQKLEEIVLRVKDEASRAFKDGKISVETYRHEIEQADKALKSLKETERQSSKGGRKEGGFFGGIDLEKSGQIGIAKQAIGGFAAFAAIRQFTEMTKALNELNQSYAAGEISEREYWATLRESIASSIPVIGEGWKLGRELRELWTEEEANDIRQAKAIEKRAEAVKYETEQRKARLKLSKEEAWLDKEFQRKAGVLLTTKEGTYERTEAERNANNAASLDSLNKSRQAEIDKLGEKVKGPSEKYLQEMREKARKMQAEIMATPGRISDAQKERGEKLVKQLNDLEAADQKAKAYEDSVKRINEHYDKRIAQQQLLNGLTDQEAKQKALEAGAKTISKAVESNAELRAGVNRLDAAASGDELGAKLAQSRADIQKQLRALDEETKDTIEKLPQELREAYAMAQAERKQLVEQIGKKREENLTSQDELEKRKEALTTEKEELQKKDKPGKLSTTFDAITSATLTGVGRAYAADIQANYQLKTLDVAHQQKAKLDSIDAELKKLNKRMGELQSGL